MSKSFLRLCAALLCISSVLAVDKEVLAVGDFPLAKTAITKTFLSPAMAFPIRETHYTFEEVKFKLSGIFASNEIENLFSEAFGFIFSLGTPKHEPKKLAEMWQCFYKHMLENSKNSDEQKDRITFRLHLHKKSIEALGEVVKKERLLYLIKDVKPWSKSKASGHHKHHT